jgi:hypothetical protein
MANGIWHLGYMDITPDGMGLPEVVGRDSAGRDGIWHMGMVQSSLV